MKKTILPGKTLGILGGGQLGRMLCLEARRMGYRTLVWSGTRVAEPVMGVADEVILKEFDDGQALTDFCSAVDVATVEFENIPLPLLRQVEGKVGLYPSAEAIGICQNREREKTFLRDNDIACTPFRLVHNADELAEGLRELGQCVLKTAEFGYDGKGQVKLAADADAAAAWAEFDAPKGVLEQWVEFEREVSVMVARDGEGQVVTYDVAENEHRQHVLDVSIAPARVSENVAAEAREIAVSVAEKMDYCGLMGVEFFVKKDGSLLVNEMAPRPHNSGHHTMDACATSQFEQQLRAVCGLRLGETKLLSPVVMLNLLGDLWRANRLEDELAKEADAYWHFYGKSSREGLRKCGHANFLGEDALARVQELKERLLA
ncbi:MAG: 5-(carboxyamino)imidazole ribonucleotide synthase [Verrucomicrobiota bacterium JB023]|nr:5-(carboxyamino)imidazole ribonucleotide synthase [Verrucomicrobiota bacterium JB023]